MAIENSRSAPRSTPARLTPKFVFDQFLSLNLFWLGAALIGVVKAGELIGFVPLVISAVITGLLMFLAKTNARQMSQTVKIRE